MSSECKCHTEDYCFYCDMYLPLEQENERLRGTINALCNKVNLYMSRIKSDHSNSRGEYERYLTGQYDTFEYVREFLHKNFNWKEVDK